MMQKVLRRILGDLMGESDTPCPDHEGRATDSKRFVHFAGPGKMGKEAREIQKVQ